MEADVTKLPLGYKKMKYGNMLLKNILPEWKLVQISIIKHSPLYKDRFYQFLVGYDAVFLSRCDTAMSQRAEEKSDKSIIRTLELEKQSWG